MISAFGWSLFDISRKKTGMLFSAPVALQVYMLLTLPIFLGWAWAIGGFTVANSYWGLGLLGILVNFLANWTFIESVSRSPLSLSVPMLAFVPVFSTVFSYLLLGEVLNTHQLFGVGVVVAGSFLLNGRPKFRGSEAGPWLMFVAAMLWALMMVIDKICLRSTSVPMHSTIQTIGIIVCTSFLLHRRGLRLNFVSSVRAGSLYLAVGVVGCVLGAGLQMLAIDKVDVAILEAVKRSANMGFTIFWAYVVFGERVTPRTFLALGVLLGGTFIVLQVL
jgi:drug/metabolite transporter (DMT)-like permease